MHKLKKKVPETVSKTCFFVISVVIQNWKIVSMIALISTAFLIWIIFFFHTTWAENAIYYECKIMLEPFWNILNFNFANILLEKLAVDLNVQCNLSAIWQSILNSI